MDAPVDGLYRVEFEGTDGGNGLGLNPLLRFPQPLTPPQRKAAKAWSASVHNWWDDEKRQEQRKFYAIKRVSI